MHRYFWEQRNPRNRLPIKISDVAEALGVNYVIANKLIIAMRDEHRLRAVDWQHTRIRVYEIADPDIYESHRPTTQARSATKPRWG